MKTLITLSIAILFATGTSAQTAKKKYFAPLMMSFAGGMADGTGETLKHHYGSFQKSFPKANPKFWNANESWRNKYENGNPLSGPRFPFSKTALVWTTDGYHLMRTSDRIFIVASFVLWPREKKKFWKRVGEGAMWSAARTAGFHFTYSFLFNE